MKSPEHATVGAVVSWIAQKKFGGDLSRRKRLLLWGYGVFLSVFIDLDHFVIARKLEGDWTHLKRAIFNPKIGLVEQEKVFEDLPDFEGERLLSHLFIGGALVLLFAILAPFVAAFTAVVVGTHMFCDVLRDRGIA
jgi:hypothetical protein